MIVINLIGGLGNQMFQYAAAKAMALETGKKLKINTTHFKKYTLHDYGLDCFSIKDSPFSFYDKIVGRLKKYFLTVVYYSETEFQFNSSLFHIKANSIYLNGYFQSEKYFLKYRPQLLEAFQIIKPLKSITTATLEEMKNQNSVSLHIRRGDYLLHEVHNTDKSEYYHEAVKLILSKIDNPIFYLFSDDMDWVKTNFKINGVMVYIDFNNAETNYEDMKLMSACKHNIIANSSFSWWSAWLNENPEKIVIAPKKWFNTDEHNFQDVIPESWIKL